MIYRCRVCNQPIPRELAVRTAAGGFTDGYCQRHKQETPDISPALEFDSKSTSEHDEDGLVEEGENNAEASETSETEVSG